eukprot:scaffold12816_cov64-Phaeocystis_antarctica.AAC.2
MPIAGFCARLRRACSTSWSTISFICATISHSSISLMLAVWSLPEAWSPPPPAHPHWAGGQEAP